MMNKIANIASPSTTEDTFIESPFKLIKAVTNFHSTSDYPPTLLNFFLATCMCNENWQRQLRKTMSSTLKSALLWKDHVSSKYLLCWSLSNLLHTEDTLSDHIASHGNKENIFYALKAWNGCQLASSILL